MRLLVVGDVHFCQYSSIVRRRGDFYSVRLENCINSIIWAERKAQELNCDRILYLGDFFDKAELNAEEISALQEIEWAKGVANRYFLVGNHEMGLYDLSYNSAHLFNLIPNCHVIDECCMESGFGFEFVYLPYMRNSNEISVKDLVNDLSRQCYQGYLITQEYKTCYIFSHNDIEMQYGAYHSDGFKLDDIKNSCSYFINGHIHNSTQVGNLINLGNLTGQNFSEDATQYEHHVLYIDTQTNDLRFIENPYAFKFYKFDILSKEDFIKICEVKLPAVVSVRCIESLVQDVRDYFEKEGVIDYRITTISEEAESTETIQELTNSDYIKSFKDYVIEQLGSTEVVLSELKELN